MTPSSFLSLGVVYTILLLVVSSLSVIPVTGQDNNDPPPSCSDQCPCSGGIPGMPGMPGLHGPQGPAGNEGAKGEKGTRGCRGDEGEQGVAGPPGDHGMDGTDGATGLKGDKGDRGDEGDQGVAGPPGVNGDKGDHGMDGTDGATGLKGDKGDRGDEGDQGVAGPPGVNGDKGIKGDTGSPGSQGSKGESGTPYIPPPLAAFRVYRTSNFHVASGYQTIDFDSVTFNIGDDYNPTSGIFTCRIPGLYNFAFHFLTNYSPSYNIDVYLMHNSNEVARAYFTPGSAGTQDTVSFSTILALDTDDEVFLRAYSSTHVHSGFHNHFGGYLIHEIPEAQ